MRTRNRPYRWTTLVCAAAILVVAGCVTPINDADLSETSTSDVSTVPDTADPEPEVLETPTTFDATGDTGDEVDPLGSDAVDAAPSSVDGADPQDAVASTPDVAVLDDTGSSPPDDEVPAGGCDAETACLEYEEALSACYIANDQSEAAKDPDDYVGVCAEKCDEIGGIDWAEHYTTCLEDNIPDDCTTEGPSTVGC